MAFGRQTTAKTEFGELTNFVSSIFQAIDFCFRPAFEFLEQQRHFASERKIDFGHDLQKSDFVHGRVQMKTKTHLVTSRAGDVRFDFTEFHSKSAISIRYKMHLVGLVAVWIFSIAVLNDDFLADGMPETEPVQIAFGKPRLCNAELVDLLRSETQGAEIIELLSDFLNHFLWEMDFASALERPASAVVVEQQEEHVAHAEFVGIGTQ